MIIVARVLELWRVKVDGDAGKVLGGVKNDPRDAIILHRQVGFTARTKAGRSWIPDLCTSTELQLIKPTEPCSKQLPKTLKP